MLKCRDVSALATEYMEGALPWRLRLATRLHLRFCGMCRNYMDQLSKTARLLRGQAMSAPDGETEQRLLASRPKP